MFRIDYFESNEQRRSFLNDYDATYVFDNDRSAIMARVHFVKRN